MVFFVKTYSKYDQNTHNRLIDLLSQKYFYNSTLLVEFYQKKNQFIRTCKSSIFHTVEICFDIMFLMNYKYFSGVHSLQHKANQKQFYIISTSHFC